MQIIIVAATEADQLELLVGQFDSAKSTDQREQVAGEIFNLVGDKIRSMISYAAKGHALPQDQIDALAWQALFRGLNESGIVRFKRDSAKDSDWQPQIQKMVAAARTSEPSPAARVWNMLSDKTKSAISQNPAYIKSTVQNLFLADLNALLRRRDFYTPLLWHKENLPFEAGKLLTLGIENLTASQLAQFNSMLVGSAFSRIEVPAPPKRNLLGYISTTVVPQLKPQIWESATGKKTDLTLIEAWSALKDDIAAVKEMMVTRTTPEEWQSLSLPEQILQQHRKRLNARYGPVLTWWNARMKEILPQSGISIRDAASLQQAKQYLEQNKDKIPEKLWNSKDAPYYLPASAFQPYGLKTIERLLSTEGFGGSQTQNAPASPLYTQPASQSESSNAEAMHLLSGGHQAPAFRWFIDRMFAAPGLEAEKAVGVFLSSTPTPSNQQVQQFLESLPEQMAEEIESVGFRNLARQIDKRILDEVNKPEIRRELQLVLGQPKSVSAALLDIRRNIFLRTSALILSRAG